MSIQPKLERFNQNVLSKYQIYNSIFLTLPFDTINRTGVLLPLFFDTCKQGFSNGENPTEIVETFFEKYQSDRSEKSQINLLFRFIQYIERQVVLFDAVEDAAFPVINNLEGLGSLRNLKETATQNDHFKALKAYLKEFKVRVVLTAHPTQFYPGNVLGIITDLTQAIRTNDLENIKNLLAQLGKTPFFKHEKPTPFDEAISLIWYLENIFYESSSEIFNYVQQNIFNPVPLNNQLITIGFWPGGDRDGNPYVLPKITLRVAERLKQSLIKCYYRDTQKLRRKLTFQGVSDRIEKLEKTLYKCSISQSHIDKLQLSDLLNHIIAIKSEIVNKHNALYLDEINCFITKIKLFGFHFASLDIRQDSRVHHSVFTKLVKATIDLGLNIFPKNYHSLSPEEQVDLLSKIDDEIKVKSITNEDIIDTLKTIEVIKKIQEKNGESGSNRYIISNTQSALNVMQLYAMLKLVAFKEELTVDIVPLFETITDLENAAQIMEQLYTNKAYREHILSRFNKQTIMLGFSDGTKDGGYLMANWAIFKAKERLTEISRKHNVIAIFFDGRGGPPARGGGNTHQFYASLGSSIEDKEVQLTIQGQTISSNFGTLESAQYNIEQLISSGISNKFNNDKTGVTIEDRETMQTLADIGYSTYSNFKNHPMFIPYLKRISTLKYFDKTNIGSRPSKRSKSSQLVFSDLRAIPFVGSWSQLKQNVPGFFGVGTALKYFEEKNQWVKIEHLYKHSNFFKTLINNSMMSLTKSFFELTEYMSKEPEFGAFWNIIYTEYKTTKRLLLKLSGFNELMEHEPSGKASIEVRESIVLPLLTIQQYALRKVQELQKINPIDTEKIAVFEKIVTRSLFGNINASRNSA